MKKILISFANEKYIKSQKILKHTAINIGKVDDVICYTHDWLVTTKFYEENNQILDQSRGAGYWIWKPYIIIETMKNLQDGDIIFYCDSGVGILENLEPLFNLASKFNIVLFKIGAIEKEYYYNKIWTKRDTFILMNCDEKKYWDSAQIKAGYSLWVKNENSIIFLNEWQKYLQDSRISTDDPNVCNKPNFLEFKDHRHDQSVLSIMKIKYDLKTFRDPACPYNNIDKDSNYGQLLNLHRRNLDKMSDNIKELWKNY